MSTDLRERLARAEATVSALRAELRAATGGASVLVLSMRLGPRERVSDALMREADRLHVSSMALLAMTAEELRQLREQAPESRVREVPAERAAQSRRVIEAIKRSPTC